MRLPSSVKLVVATWIAALLGALAGGSAAHAYGAPLHQRDAHATVAADDSKPPAP
jgi:hypothetical protein